MANKKSMEWHVHRGKPLLMAGIILFLIGALRSYNIDWNIVLMVIGAVLIVKGLVIKSMQK